MNLCPCLVLLCLFVPAFASDELISESSGDIWLKFTENQAPYFTTDDAAVFLTVKPFFLTNYAGSHLKIEIQKNNETSDLQVYFLACSSKPDQLFNGFPAFTNFVQTSCYIIIPMHSYDEVDNISCFDIKGPAIYLLLLSVTGNIQQSLHHQVHITSNEGSCGQPLKSIITTQNALASPYYDDAYLPQNSSSVEKIVLRYAGAIAIDFWYRKVMIWAGLNQVISFVVGSEASLVVINKNITAHTVFVRYILASNIKTLSDLSITFLTYSGSGQLVKSTTTLPFQPMVSPNNPHVCHNPFDHEEELITVDNMEVGAVKPIGKVIPQVSIMACLHDVNTKNCYSNFMPIFSVSPIILPPNSSYFLGPSAQRDRLAIKFHGKDKRVFCLDLEVKSNSEYRVDVMIFAAPGGTIPPQSYHYIDLSCLYDYDEHITAIMYRTHTHGLGRYVLMWVEQQSTWNLLAAENRTDVILPLYKPFKIRTSDKLNVRCAYDTHAFNIPSPISQSGEMCNFYLYYIINASSNQSIKDCFIQKTLYPPSGKDRQLYHQLPRRRFTYGTNLQLKKIWSLKSQKAKHNFDISNLGHIDRTLVILEGSSDHISQDSHWFNDDNTLVNYLNTVETDSVTLFSTRSNSVIHSAGRSRFYLPTGLHVTSEKEIFITDLGLHQVMKYSNLHFDPNDVPDLFLGTAFVPGNDSSHFCKPSSVFTDSNKNIYVGDGYCNSRIAKFSYDGHFVASYGTQSSVRGLPGTFGEVTDMTFDTTREVILALDNKLLQIQVMDFNGNFYQVIDLSGFRNVLKVCYSVDMDAIVILTSYGLDNIIFILDPVSGSELNFITGGTKVFTAVTAIQGNNTLLVGDQYGTISLFTDTRIGINEVYKDSKVHEFSVKKEGQGRLDDSLSKLTPLIHFLHISGLSEEKVVRKSHGRFLSLSPTGIFSTAAATALIVIVVVVFFMMCCKSKEGKEEYERCLMSDSEEEDVLYDHEAL